jgi:peptidoglycan glycosyltransferase
MEYALALQRLVALGALALVVLPLARVRPPAGAPVPPRALATFAGAVGGLLLLTLAWQAYWTLTPDLSPGWRASTQFDSRAFRLRTLSDRRGLADRFGWPLAINAWQDGKVVRRYLLGRAAAHVTGYHHPRFGQAGAEGACNEFLATWRRPAWDILGNAPQSGPAVAAPLRLTLDARLQAAAAKALGERPGAVVVLAVPSGEVLALVSAPSFQPETLTPQSFQPSGHDQHSPLFNRALHGLYPPGSTFKPLLAAAAMAAGYGPQTSHETPPEGFLAPGDHQPIKDHEESEALHNGQDWTGHGRLDMRGALVCSSNGYFAWLGCELGGPAILEAAHLAGLDQTWPLVPAEHPAADLTSAAGHLPPKLTWPGEIARCAIGQDQILVTPLHMALLAGTIAADGWLAPPRLVLEGRAGAPRQVMTPAIARSVASLMASVVSDPRGTAHGLRGTVPVAAKTGSAENNAGAAHGWVIGFAPADHPTLAFAVLVEHGETGAKSAVPIARAVLDAAESAGWCPRPAPLKPVKAAKPKHPKGGH